MLGRLETESLSVFDTGGSQEASALGLGPQIARQLFQVCFDKVRQFFQVSSDKVNEVSHQCLKLQLSVVFPGSRGLRIVRRCRKIRHFCVVALGLVRQVGRQAWRDT